MNMPELRELQGHFFNGLDEDSKADDIRILPLATLFSNRREYWDLVSHVLTSGNVRQSRPFVNARVTHDCQSLSNLSNEPGWSWTDLRSYSPSLPFLSVSSVLTSCLATEIVIVRAFFFFLGYRLIGSYQLQNLGPGRRLLGADFSALWLCETGAGVDWLVVDQTQVTDESGGNPHD